jgi:hypothetical protein
MSAEPDTAPDLHDDGSRVHCWCCSSVDTPDRMVHLGDHPEVHLCPGCAHFVHQQAWEIDDAGKRGPAALVRDRFRNLRAAVIRRGWHHNRFIGRTLRSLDKYLP